MSKGSEHLLCLSTGRRARNANQRADNYLSVFWFNCGALAGIRFLSDRVLCRMLSARPGSVNWYAGAHVHGCCTRSTSRVGEESCSTKSAVVIWKESWRNEG